MPNCFVCEEDIQGPEIAIEYSSIMNLQTKGLIYRHLHRDCFLECGLDVDALQKTIAYMSCPWCYKSWDHYNTPRKCVQLIDKHSVFARPCNLCWEKHGVEL